VHSCILFLNLTGVGSSFRRNGGSTKSESSHFSDTNYTASIMRVSTDSARGEGYFALEPNRIEFN